MPMDMIIIVKIATADACMRISGRKKEKRPCAGLVLKEKNKFLG